MPLSKKEKGALYEALDYFQDEGMLGIVGQLQAYIDVKSINPKDGEVWEVNVSYTNSLKQEIRLLATWNDVQGGFCLLYDYPVRDFFELNLGMKNISITPVKKVGI